ncbi:sigma-70 family RNA polymerase sigma factor [Neobacillus sp. SCS-31]|uniref:sigma-70 family RNA polymerase sigma factor n=1 Tax=Neobacillus oceani TaxID=3115292 RepID=UPI003905EACA
MIVSEENVVQQIKLKNEEAIAFLLRNYGGLLNSIIRKYLGSQQDIEECFADVITSIWYHIHSFDPNKNEFKQWIAAIAKYKAIDSVRKSAKEMQLVKSIEIKKRNATHSHSIIENFSAEDLLLELSDVERIIFEKYYIEGVPSSEIATQFNLKESWVHNKLSRGRKRLKSILKKSEVF